MECRAVWVMLPRGGRKGAEWAGKPSALKFSQMSASGLPFESVQWTVG